MPSYSDGFQTLIVFAQVRRMPLDVTYSELGFQWIVWQYFQEEIPCLTHDYIGFVQVTSSSDQKAHPRLCSEKSLFPRRARKSIILLFEPAVFARIDSGQTPRNLRALKHRRDPAVLASCKIKYWLLKRISLFRNDTTLHFKQIVDSPSWLMLPCSKRFQI